MPQELQVMIKIVMSIVSRVRINIDTFDKTFKGSCTYYVIADREGGSLQMITVLHREGLAK